MNSSYTRSDRRIFAASSTVVIVLALSAAILSYSALRELAIMSGIHPILALLFPLVIDGLILSGTLLILFFATRGRRTAFGIFLTLLGVVASIAGNVAVSDNVLIHQLVHGAPALVLFLALEALTILLRTRFKENKAYMQPGGEAVEGTKKEPDEEQEYPQPVEDEKPTQEPQNAPESHVSIITPSNSSAQPQSVVEPPVSDEKRPSLPVHEKKSLPVPTQPYKPQNAPVIPSERVERPVSPMTSEKPVSVPARSTAPSQSPTPQKKTPQPSRKPTSGKKVMIEEDGIEYIVIEGSKREQIESLLQQNSEIRPKTVAEVLGGDRSYSSKILRELRET